MQMHLPIFIHSMLVPGANVTKNVPEMALKLTCNDRVKARFTRDGRQVTFGERLAIGGVSGAIAQVCDTSRV